MKIVAVVQARMASQRLPGKVMKLLGSRRALGWAVHAARRAVGVDEVVVATSTNEENNELEKWCHHNKIECFRGSEDDVLSRYVGVIQRYKPDAVVRLTADCPLLDTRVIGEVIALFKSTGVDYAANVDPPTWPDGLDAEVVSAEALMFSSERATDPVDRDCLTQYIIRNRTIFPAVNLTCPLPGMYKERWVLDSPEDYTLLKTIFEYFPDEWDPNYLDVKAFLDEQPQLRNLNTNWFRNQRFFQSVGSQEPPAKSYIHTQRCQAQAKRIIPFASQTFSKSTLFFPDEGYPGFASHGDGGYIFDVDGNRYVDLVGALGPNILGYRDPDVDWAVRQQLDRGVTFSLATELEAELAEKLIRLIPCAEMCKFGKNGSDVTGAAVKIARACTGKDFIAKVDDGYHGWHDWTMAMDNGGRNKGIPRYILREVKDQLDRNEWNEWNEWAALIVNPEGYDQQTLQYMRRKCDESGTLLIFDEIKTGFRYSLGGYQDYIGVTPDLACFSKAMANGYPVSTLVGKKEYMQVLEDPNVFWSGTFFGEAVSIAAAIATINKMEAENVLRHIHSIGATINEYVQDLLYTYSREEMVFKPNPAHSIWEIENKELHKHFLQLMAEQGVLILNSHMLCYAHKQDEVNRILSAYEHVIRVIGRYT